MLARMAKIAVMLAGALAAALCAGPAPALTVDQVVKLRQAGVSNETIEMLLAAELKAKRQGGVGHYVRKQADGREVVVYEASTPRGVVDYPVDTPVDAGGGAMTAMDRASVILGAPRREAKAGKAAPARAGRATEFTLHLASFKSAGRADKMVAALQAKGVPARSSQVDLGDKGVWHRVLAGSYATVDAADEAGQTLKTKGDIESYRPIPAD